MSTEQRFKLAILDDYADIAPAKFSSISDRLDIVPFPETLNAKSTSRRKALIERLQPYSIISTMRERTAFPREVLTELPNLKLLCTTGMRNASIDLKTCAERGIVVAGTTGQTNTNPSPPGYNPTTEHTWALILGLAKGIASNDKAVKEGGWQSGLALGLAGKTLALLGLGRLGAACAKTAVYGFGMKITAWSTNLTQDRADELAEAAGLPKGTYRVTGSKQELFETGDILSIQYVLSDRSRGIVGEKELSGMKKNALLVNTSRGPLVDEQALLRVLKEGRIRGAALDVFDVEPVAMDSEWRTTRWGQDGRSEVLLSPHMGYVEERTMHTWYEETAESVEQWLNGKEVKKRIQSIW
jgi:lactate dehydrogenase-like 2-hydroxyacid dehydrogenase